MHEYMMVMCLVAGTHIIVRSDAPTQTVGHDWFDHVCMIFNAPNDIDEFNLCTFSMQNIDISPIFNASHFNVTKMCFSTGNVYQTTFPFHMQRSVLDALKKPGGTITSFALIDTSLLFWPEFISFLKTVDHNVRHMSVRFYRTREPYTVNEHLRILKSLLTNRANKLTSVTMNLIDVYLTDYVMDSIKAYIKDTHLERISCPNVNSQQEIDIQNFVNAFGRRHLHNLIEKYYQTCDALHVPGIPSNACVNMLSILSKESWGVLNYS